MSCGHGWHGCEQGYGPHYGRAWHEPIEPYEEEGWPVRRHSGRYRRLEQATGPGALEAKLDALREEVHQVAAALANLQGSAEPDRS